MKKNDNFIMKLLPTIQEKESSDGKYSILDVLVLLKYGTKIDFEMQLNYYLHWDKRSIYYLSRMLTSGIRSGEEYRKTKKCR